MSKLRSTKEILQQWEGLERPEDGSIYRHYKGGRYEIIATGFMEDSESPCVVYRSLEKEIVWVRTAKNFLETIEYEGRQVRRFAPLS